MKMATVTRRGWMLVAAMLVAGCSGGESGGQSGEASQAASTGPLECPVKQPKVENGAKPDEALFRRIIRCAKGEKTVPEGQEGAVEVEVKSVEIGSSRPWSYRQDSGTGQADTIVYPVKATYTVRTLYRAATEEEADWIRVLNFYVDSFGEWRIGSEEPVKPGDPKRIPRS
jgi:hypothetical protein